MSSRRSAFRILLPEEKSLLAVFAFCLAGCGIPGVERTATERLRFDVQEGSRVEVRLHDGSIEVAGSPATSNEVTVEVTKRARGRSVETASTMLDQIVIDAHQQGATVSVRVRSDMRWEWDDDAVAIGPSWLRADVDMQVPQETELVLITQEGSIEIDDLSGHIVAETGDGRVRLVAVRGVIRGRTEDGSVVGSDLEGEVDVVTEDGSIELEGRFQSLRAMTSDGRIRIRCRNDSPPLTDDWMIRSSDGSISLTLPRALSAELEASTSDGHVDSEIPLTMSERSENRLRGRLGSGGKQILVRTLDGRISLRGN